MVRLMKTAPHFSHRLAVAGLALICGGAEAADPASPAAPETPPPSMQAFGLVNARCLEWTDACLVCRRLDRGPGKDASEQEIICSTPGIACLPVEIRCTADAP